MRWTIAWQTGKRLIRNAGNAALSFRARYLARITTASVAFNGKPCAVLDLSIGQHTRIVRNARQLLTMLQSFVFRATAHLEAAPWLRGYGNPGVRAQRHQIRRCLAQRAAGNALIIAAALVDLLFAG